MTRKEMMDLFLCKLPEEKREGFLKDVRSVKTKKGTKELLEKYGIELSEAEYKRLNETVQKDISAEDLKNVAGGVCDCACYCCHDLCLSFQCWDIYYP